MSGQVASFNGSYLQQFGNVHSSLPPGYMFNVAPPFNAQPRESFPLLGPIPTSSNFIFREDIGPPGNYSVGIKANSANPIVYHGFQFRNQIVPAETLNCVRIRLSVKQLTRLTGPNFGGLERHEAHILVSPSNISDLLGSGWVPQPSLSIESVISNNIPPCTGSSVILDGNLPANIGLVDVVIRNLNVPPGHFFSIRWTDVLDGNCDLPFLSIDNVQLDKLTYQAPAVTILTPSVTCKSFTAKWTTPDSMLVDQYNVILKDQFNNEIQNVIVPAFPLSHSFTNLDNTKQYTVFVASMGDCQGTNLAFGNNSTPLTLSPTPIGTAFITPSGACNSGVFAANIGGSNGTAFQWQVSNSCDMNYTDMPGEVTMVLSLQTLTSSKCFRARILSNGCEVNSNSVRAEVIPVPSVVEGITANPPSFCVGGSSMLTVPTQQSGTVVLWEKSPVGCAAFTGTGFEGNNVNTGILTAPMCYRFLVRRGTCVSAPSNPITVYATTFAQGSVSANPNAVCLSGSSTLTLSGHDVAANIVWEKQINCANAPILISGVTTATLTETVATTTCFRAVLTKNNCTKETSWARVEAQTANVVTGTISGTTSICPNEPVSLTLAGFLPGDAQLTWEKVPAPGNICPTVGFFNSNVGGPNYNTSQLVSSYCYRVIVHKGACTEISPAHLVTVSTAASGTITPPPAMCGAGTVNLTLSGSNGFIQWFRIPNCFGTPQLFGGNTATISDNISANTCYVARISLDGCFKESNTVQAIVSDNAQAGPTRATRTTVCSGSHSDTLTLSSFRGDIQWQKGSVCGAFNDIPGATSPTLVVENLTQTTCYVARVTRAGCPDVLSNTITMNVVPGVNLPTVSAPTSICRNEQATFQVTNPQNGAVYNWDGLPNGAVILSGQGTPIVNIGTSGVVDGSFTSRVTATIAGCPNGQIRTFNYAVIPPTEPGAIFSVNPSSVCQNSNTVVTMTISGGTGSIIRWEKSENNFINVSTIANITSVQTVSNLSTTTSFRAVFRSGSCNERASFPVVVNVNSAANAGSITPSTASTCAGGQALFNISNPPNGQIVRWESSTDNFVNITTINNQQFFLFVTGANVTTKYRAVVSIPNSGCPEVFTANPATLVVSPASIGGTAGPALSVCSGSNTATIGLTGQVGDVQFWESSNDNFLTSTRISSTSTSITVNNLTQTMSYRAFVKNANCIGVPSTSAEITVLPGGQNGQLFGPATVCNGNNGSTLQLQGGNGTITRWESIVGNVITTIANTSNMYVYSNLTQTTQFQVVSQNANCGVVTSNRVTITVLEQSAGGTTSATSANICGGGSTTISVTGNTGTVQHWQRSENCNDPWTTIFVNTPSINTGVLVSNACFRASVASNGCGNVNSSTTLVTVNNVAISNITKRDVSCRGANDAQIEIIANGAPSIEYSINGGANYFLDNIFRNLGPGTYIVLARNATTHLCATQPQVIIINQPPTELAISDAIITQASCNSGVLGSIDISISGLNGSPSYLWSNQAITEDIQNLVPGTYSVTVTDNSSSCTVRETYTITGGTPINLTGVVTNSTCNGGNNGTITLNVSGGTGLKTYLWNDGSVLKDRTNLSTGTYSVTVTDAVQCRDSESFDVNDGSSITLSFANVVDVPCQNATSGSMEVQATGGVLPYTYRWSSNAGNSTSASVSGLTAGEYQVTVTDASGCVKIGSKTIIATSSVENLAASATPSAVCQGSSVSLRATSSRLDVTYQWFTTPSGGTAFATGTSVIVTPTILGQNTYYVQAFLNSNPNCLSARVSVSVNVSILPVAATISGTSPICGGQTTTLSLGNFNGSVIRWEASNNNFGNITTINSTLTAITTPVLNSTTQFRVVTGGCTELTSNPFTIEVTPGFSAGTISGSGEVCPGDNSTTLNLVGQTGALVRWEGSRDNFVTFTTINNPSTQFIVTNLTVTTSFRAVVRSGSNPNCDTQTSGIATITVRNNCGQIVVNPSSLAFGNVNPSCLIPTRSYTVAGTQLLQPIEIAAPSNVLISLSSNTGFGSGLTLTPINGRILETTIFVKFSPNVPSGSYTGNINHTSGLVDARLVAVSGSISNSGLPILTSPSSVIAFGQVLVGNTANKSYRVTGSNLTSSVVSVSINSPFSISTSLNGVYSQTLDIPVSQCGVDAEVFVKVSFSTTGRVESPILHRSGQASLDLQATAEGVNTITEADVVSNSSWGSQQDVDNTFGPGRYTFGVNAFSGLQAAVNRTPEDKVLMLMGPNHYSSNTVIDRPITIIGDDQATIRPLSGGVNTYLGDNPDDALSSNFSNNHALIIRSNEVVIKNIKIDGGVNNPCENRFGVGIITDNRSGQNFSEIEIENVEISHVYSRGIQLYNVAPGNQISNVTVDDVCMRFNSNPLVAAEAAGIYINVPSEVTNNVVTNAGTGIIADNLGNTGITQINQNEVQFMVEDGIRVDTKANMNSSVQVASNRISNIGDAGIEARGLGDNAVIGGSNGNLGNQILINSNNPNDPGIGIRLSSSNGSEVINNTIIASGLESGMHLLANNDLNNQVSVNANTINRTGSIPVIEPQIGQGAGVFMSDNGAFLDGANSPSYATFYGNEISGFYINFFSNGNGVDGNVQALIASNPTYGSNTFSNAHEGIRVNGRSKVRTQNNARSIINSDIGIRVYGGDAEIVGNSLHNNKIAVKVEDKPGISGIAIITDNLFYDNELNVVNASNVANNIVDASWNWWGTNDANVLRPLNKGNVDYSPFYATNEDIDNNLDNGFLGIRTSPYVDALSAKANGQGHIQEAVNEAVTQTVNVVDGVYDETTNVNRSIKFTNDGIGFNPVIVNLTMSNSLAILDLVQNFDITGTLTLNGGKINVANGKLLSVLRGGSTTTGNDDSYVMGSFARQSANVSSTELYYPIGSINAFRPAALTVAQSVGTLNTYVGQVIQPNNYVKSIPTTITSVSNARLHNFRKVGNANITSANIRLAFGFDEPSADVAIVKDSDGIGTSWSDLGGNMLANFVTSSQGFSNLGNFVLATKVTGGNNGGGNNGGGTGGTTVIPSVITEINSITTSSAFIKWSMPNCQSPRYEFRYRVTGDLNWVNVTNLNNNFYFLVALQPATRYEVSVRSACGNLAFSDWSTTILNNFTTLTAGTCESAIPPVPGGFFVNTVTTTTAKLNWNLTTTSQPQGTIIGYGPISTSPSAWAQVVVCHPANSFNLTGLQGNTIYGVRIRTNCSNCTTALNSNDRRSNWATIVTFNTGSKREENVSSEVTMSVYPNPNKGNFTVIYSAENNDNVSFKLVDVTGKVVFNREVTTQEGENQLDISLNDFTSGLYMLQVKNGDVVKSVKVVIE